MAMNTYFRWASRARSRETVLFCIPPPPPLEHPMTSARVA